MRAKIFPEQRYEAAVDLQSGVMLMGLLILLAIMGLVVTKTSEVWSTTLVREREQELPLE